MLLQQVEMARISDCPVEIFQYERELWRMLEIYRTLRPRRVLEIGSLYGGTLWFWMQYSEPGAVIVSIDLILPTIDHRFGEIIRCQALWQPWAEAAQVNLVTLHANSNEAAIVRQAARHGPFDFIFVDGGHDYETVQNDYEKYWPMVRPGGVMAFHDIAYPDLNSPHQIDVGRWWRDLKMNGHRPMAWLREMFDHDGQDDWGIGVLVKGEVGHGRSA